MDVKADEPARDENIPCGGFVDDPEAVEVQRLIAQRAEEAPTRTFPPVAVVRDINASATPLGDDPCPLV